MSHEYLMRAMLENPVEFAKTSKQFFTEADTDKSGAVDAGKLLRLMTKIAHDFQLPTPTEADAQQTLAQFDADHDGQLSPHEFDGFVRQTLELIAAKFTAKP